MAEQKTTKETKEALDLVLSLADLGQKAMADGKVDMNDLALILALVPRMNPGVDGMGQIPAELADLTDVEAADLIAYVMSKLTVGDAKAKSVVEAALKAAAANLALVRAIKA